MENGCSIRCSARGGYVRLPNRPSCAFCALSPVPTLLPARRSRILSFSAFTTRHWLLLPWLILGGSTLRLTNPPMFILLTFTPTILQPSSRRSTLNAPLP